jgi:hypothetical protein
MTSDTMTLFIKWNIGVMVNVVEVVVRVVNFQTSENAFLNLSECVGPLNRQKIMMLKSMIKLDI